MGWKKRIQIFISLKLEFLSLKHCRSLFQNFFRAFEGKVTFGRVEMMETLDFGDINCAGPIKTTVYIHRDGKINDDRTVKTVMTDTL